MKIAGIFKRKNRNEEWAALVSQLKRCRYLLNEQNKELEELRWKVLDLENEKSALLRALKEEVQKSKF